MAETFYRRAQMLLYGLLSSSVIVLALVAITVRSEHEIEDPLAGLPEYKVSTQSFIALENDRSNPDSVFIDGKFSTWIDKETGEVFLYVSPTVHTFQKPDRMTIFTQFSSDDGTEFQSTICDMYTSIDLATNPTQTDEQILFYTLEKPIIIQDRTAVNGYSIIKSIREVSWDPIWKFSLENSSIVSATNAFENILLGGRTIDKANQPYGFRPGDLQNDHNDGLEFTCSMFRVLSRDERQDNPHIEPLVATNIINAPHDPTDETKDRSVFHKDVLPSSTDDFKLSPRDGASLESLKIGQTISFQVGYQQMFDSEKANGTQDKSTLVSRRLQIVIQDGARRLWVRGLVVSVAVLSALTL